MGAERWRDLQESWLLWVCHMGTIGFPTMLLVCVEPPADASFFRLRTLPTPVDVSFHKSSLVRETGTGGDMSIGES